MAASVASSAAALRGAGSIAMTRPAAPTARASGMVHSPRLAPTSIATEPGLTKASTVGCTRGGWSSACRPRASSGAGPKTRSPVRCRVKPPGQSRSVRLSRRFSRHRRTNRATRPSGSPGGRSFQSAFKKAIIRRRSAGSRSTKFLVSLPPWELRDEFIRSDRTCRRRNREQWRDRTRHSEGAGPGRSLRAGSAGQIHATEIWYRSRMQFTRHGQHRSRAGTAVVDLLIL